MTDEEKRERDDKIRNAMSLLESYGYRIVDTGDNERWEWENEKGNQRKTC